MRRHAILAIACCLLLPACNMLPAAIAEDGRWRIEVVGELARPDLPGSESMGGITWISNSVYWAVTDWNPVVWELDMPADPATGKLSGCTMRELCRPADAIDVEGIARDPLDGSMWIADERAGRIKRHDPVTGIVTGAVELPEIMKGVYKDLGLESLMISDDGLTMWTCAEAALRCDGPYATRTDGTDVRLMRFARTAADAPWRNSGQWVYHTDSIAGGSWHNSRNQDLSRCGIAELCALDDRTLLVLEREFSKVMIPRLRCRIYEADLSAATDVQGLASVTNAPSLKRATKRLLFETTGFSMYEGMCLGPRLEDGSRLLVLVSDGDKRTLRSVMALRLYRKP